MRIGEYRVKLNYSILKGFLDALGLLMVLAVVDLARTYAGQCLYPDRVLYSIYPDGVPTERWLPGLILPIIALIYVIISVIYVFVPKRLPHSFTVTADNAQQYYDHIMYANSIIRILALLAMWDYSYIIQNYLMFINESWISIQALCDIAVGTAAVIYIRSRIRKFAPLISEENKDAKTE